MVKKIIFFFNLLICMSSCQHTNDYYTDINDSNKEKVDISVENFELSVSALKYDNNLEISLYIKAKNESAYINDINIKINDINDLSSKRKAFFCENTKIMNFIEFSEIDKEINDKIESKKCIIIYYKFTGSEISSMGDLDFNLIIKTKSDIFKKNIKMNKHSRYKFW